MLRWLTHGVILAVLMSIFGCVSSPTINWTNEKIGFTRTPQLGGTDSLWIMNGDGSGQAQLDVGADGNSSLTWSPDGNSIAFESVRDGHIELYTARIISNGNDTVTPITSGNYQDLSPSWSPDGSKIAFTRHVGNASREIYIHVMSSGQDIRLTNNSVNDTDPSWSPSGRIIFARHSEDGSRAALFEMDAVDANGDGNGDHLASITTPNENEYDQKPEYFWNGKAILFFRSQEAGGGGPGDVYKLLIQDGTVMEPLLNLTHTNPPHEHGATWKRNG